MKELHEKLKNNSEAYAKWHDYKHQQLIQWLILILVMTVISLLLIDRANKGSYGLQSEAGKPGGGVTIPPLALNLVFTHTEAAADAAAAAAQTPPYSTTVGIIRTIKDFNGKLYFGYGDYGLSQYVGWGSDLGGGVAIRSYDPVTGTSTREFTENHVSQISRYMTIGNRLYAGSVEDEGGGSDASPEFAYRSTNSSVWTGGNSPALFIHMFDIASLNGQDLWLFGGTYPYDGVVALAGGSAIHSPDGGTTWESRESATYLNTTDSTPSIYPRLYFGAAYNGKLYTQNPAATHSNIYDPAIGSWTTGPDMLPDAGSGKYPRYGYGSHPLEFAGKLLYGANPAGSDGFDRLLSFDGSRVTDGLRLITRQFSSAADLQIYNGYLYALVTGSSGYAIVRTLDLAHWESVGRLAITITNWPDLPYSFRILNDIIYIGFGNSKVYSAQMPSSFVPLN